MRIFSLFRGPAPLEPEIVNNALHATFHPAGLRQFVVNWEELAAPLIHTLHREAAASEVAERLRDALLAYPGVPARWRVPDPAAAAAPVLSMRLKRGDLSLAFFSTITTLATPQDVTVQQYTAIGLLASPYIAPPAIGPSVAAVWKIDELHATALGKCSGETNKGRNDCDAGPLKARTTPFRTNTA